MCFACQCLCDEATKNVEKTASRTIQLVQRRTTTGDTSLNSYQVVQSSVLPRPRSMFTSNRKRKSLPKLRIYKLIVLYRLKHSDSVMMIPE